MLLMVIKTPGHYEFTTPLYRSGARAASSMQPDRSLFANTRGAP